MFNETVHSVELDKNLKFDKELDLRTKELVTQIVKDYRDSFVTMGAKHTILGYEFDIDTAGTKPVCYRKSLYGHYKSIVISEQVCQLLINGYIEK